MYGKIIDGNLVIAGNTIKDGNTTITNPSEEILTRLGYKEIEYCDKPEYDKETMKLQETYTEYPEKIFVAYGTVELSPAEHNAIIKAEIVEEEKKITDRNYRESIKDLKEKKETSYALSKIDEIEANIAALRAKLVEEPQPEVQEQN